MGGHYTEIVKVSERGKEKTFEELIYHPSFKLPPLPDFLRTRPEDKPMAVVDYVTEVVARFLSPAPKMDGESEEFSCNDLAKAIRVYVSPLIKSELLKARD